uniref:Putative conserved secreted protein n=1 Tax=Culex tarsalis TaxID=7177 RepID=A0A1Q3EV41_CULTA
MKALGLLILSAIFDCSVGYTIVERPAKFDEKEFSLNRNPSGVVQSRPQVGFWLQQHPYNLPKSEPQALFELYYLIQVITIYRRQHPRAHRSHLDALVEELQDDDFQQKLRQTLLGVKELNVLQAYIDLNLQDYAPFVNDRRQLIPAIHRTLNEINLSQVKDKDLRWTLERLKEESTAMTVKMARKEAAVLRDLIESNRKIEKVWTVSNILAAVFGKQDDEDTMKDFEQKYEVVDDGKPVDDGKVEEFWVVFEDDKREESTAKAPLSSSTVEPFQFIDDNYEQYEAKQEIEVVAEEEEVEQSTEQISELKEVDATATVDEVEQSLEQEFEPKEEVKSVSEEEVAVESLEQDTAVEREDNVVEDETVDEFLEQESTDDLNGEQRIVSDGFEFKEENYERSDLEEEGQDYERTVPEEDGQGFDEKVVAEEELPDPVPEELQTLDASVETEEVPEPEYSEVDEELQRLEDSVKTEEQPEPEFNEELEQKLSSLDGSVEVGEVSEPEYAEKVVEKLQNLDDSEEPVEQPEPEVAEELEEQLPNVDVSVEAEPVYKEAVEGKLQSLDGSEEPKSELTQDLKEEMPEPAAAKTSSDSITFPEDPQWVDDSVRPLTSSAGTGLDSAPPKVVYDSDRKPASEVDTPVTQSVPLWISKGFTAEYEGREVVDEDAPLLQEVQEANVDTNELESRAEPIETVEIDQETLRYVAFEILKVVSLLEDNAGFAGLRDQITSDDVDRLIEQLSVEQLSSLIDEQGINRVEMINALKRLIVEKNLENSGEIVAILEQWKQGEDEVESRVLDEEEVATPEEAQDVESLVEEAENGVDGQVEDSEGDALDEVEPEEVTELEGVQELKSNDLADAELVEDGYFGKNYGKAEENEHDVESRMLDIDEVATSEEGQEQEVEPQPEGVQELRSNDVLDDAYSKVVDDGYFAENYGKSDDEAEMRTLEDDQILEGSELVVATPEEAQDAERLVDELEGELKGDAELQVEDSEALDGVAAEAESVQELKADDLVEDAELLNDSPELLEDATDISESILKVENLEKLPTSDNQETKNIQPFPEEVTEDTQPLKDIQRVDEVKKLQPFPEEVTKDTVPLERAVQEKKLQPFPEEVTEQTVPVVEVGDLTLKSLEPFPDQILKEAQPLEVALEDQLDQLEPFPDQIVNETQPLEIAAEDQLDESDTAVDNPKIVPVSNRPFPATSTGGSEPLEVARAGTDEGALANEDRREEILEDQHPEP